ncbi:MAG TPA: hypothetical protein EYG17_04140, partial [Acidimicrobiia bacterium]|nr:hypothetical protein [Acidimicrobiia bacterium]
MEIRRNLLRLLAVLFAFALVAAACGSSDDDDSSSSASSSESADEAEAADEAEEAEEEGGTLSQDAIEKAVSGEDDGEEEEEVASDCPSDRSNVEGIFAEADCSRDAIIAKITEKMEAGEWGVNSANHLIGPEGMDVD